MYDVGGKNKVYIFVTGLCKLRKITELTYLLGSISKYSSIYPIKINVRKYSLVLEHI